MSANKSNYTVLSGGVGGAKLALGLEQALKPGQLSVIANTGDDFEHLGYTICPDIDTLLYTLSGEVNPATGWGRRDESWQFMAALEALGGPTWFRLGDRDLATHAYRTSLLQRGSSLSQVTDSLRQSMHISTPVLPMSDEPVHTIIHSDAGDLPFQDYFVRRQAEPVVREISYGNCSTAAPTEGALSALRSDALAGIIISPSNPWLSIAPILSLTELQSTILNAAAPVVAVSPIIGGRAVKGPTAKIMSELGIPVDATGIAAYYRDIIDGLVIDTQDAAHKAEIEKMGVKVTIANTLMNDLADKVRLAEGVIRFCDQIATANYS